MTSPDRESFNDEPGYSVFWVPCLTSVVGGEVPTRGAAVSSDDFYVDGERRGRVLRLVYMPGGVSVEYIPTEGTP